MAIVKSIVIDGIEVPFRASAAIPRMYRIKFRRDIFKDLEAIVAAVGENEEGASTLDTFTLEAFENIAYMMAKYADPKVPDTPEEWLDQFSTFSIYQIVPEIVELWALNAETEVESKKELDRLTGK